VTQDGKVYACGEATNGRLGLGLSTGSVSVPRQLSVLSQYVIRKVAVHSGPSAFNSLTRANKIALIQPSSGSTIHTTVLRLSGFCPWQPVWAGTRRIVHPLTPIVVISHPLSAFSICYDPWHPPHSIFVPDNLFPQFLSKFSLVYLLSWHPPLHTPYISSPNHCLLFAAHAYTRRSTRRVNKMQRGLFL